MAGSSIDKNLLQPNFVFWQEHLQRRVQRQQKKLPVHWYDRRDVTAEGAETDVWRIFSRAIHVLACQSIVVRRDLHFCVVKATHYQAIKHWNDEYNNIGLSTCFNLSFTYEEKRNTAKHKANFDVSCQLLMYNQFIDI